MIPPSQQLQQAMAMQQAMTAQKPEDPLMQALSKQAMAGEVLKASADHKMKMLKIKTKYGIGQAPPVQPAQGGQGPMGNIY